MSPGSREMLASPAGEGSAPVAAPPGGVREPQPTTPFVPSPLDRLIQEHAEAVEAYAEGWSMYGQNGAWSDVRKSLLSAIAARIRATKDVAGVKTTEGAIDEAAHAHPDYRAYLDRVVAERAAYIVREWEVKMLAKRIDAYIAGRV